GTLRASAYVESVKGTLDESGLMDVVMGLGLSTAAIRGSMTYEGASGAKVPKDYSQTREYWKKDVDFKDTKVYQRNGIIDINRVDVKGRSNLQRMEQGLAPLGPDGNPVNLHHMTQRDISSIAEVEQSFHQTNSKTIHINPNSVPSGIDRKSFNKWRSDYWENRAKDFK
ncbi:MULTISPECIES: HNH/ENDO VII family nuclease, partial [Listeria]